VNDSRPEPQPAAVVEFYKAQWSDLHHTRGQSWESVKIVVASGIAVKGLAELIGAGMTITILYAMELLIVLFGLAAAWNNNRIFGEKLEAITKAEEQLRVTDLLPSSYAKDPRYPRFSIRQFSTANLIIAIHFLVLLMFVCMFIASLLS
jgi:hypothetical protein